MNQEVAKEFSKQIIYRMNESTRMITLSFEQLIEEDVWKRPNANSNSIGNLILHLCGNITQYAIASLGNKQDKRQRDAEFEAEEGYSKKELLEKLMDTVDEAKNTIQNVSVSELLREREVQGFVFSGIGILIHVAEHYSYHTGQIAFWTKQLKDKKSLGFYDGIDLNIKNE
ncbi:DinB family protein [Aquimarina sp. AU119]|uniref:DinB family protein n=1 Tax=Aquimarina sp. AU119 TaxID=2108528 RepID=UPI000D6971BE|nr:DinB family protein [Aquimarina sp. AU119]